MHTNFKINPIDLNVRQIEELCTHEPTRKAGLLYYYSKEPSTQSDYLGRANAFHPQPLSLSVQGDAKLNLERRGNEEMEQNMTHDRHLDRFNLS